MEGSKAVAAAKSDMNKDAYEARAVNQCWKWDVPIRWSKLLELQRGITIDSNKRVTPLLAFTSVAAVSLLCFHSGNLIDRPIRSTGIIAPSMCFRQSSDTVLNEKRKKSSTPSSSVVADFYFYWLLGCLHLLFGKTQVFWGFYLAILLMVTGSLSPPVHLTVAFSTLDQNSVLVCVSGTFSNWTTTSLILFYFYKSFLFTKVSGYYESINSALRKVCGTKVHPPVKPNWGQQNPTFKKDRIHAL